MAIPSAHNKIYSRCEDFVYVPNESTYYAWLDNQSKIVEKGRNTPIVVWGEPGKVEAEIRRNCVYCVVKLITKSHQSSATARYTSLRVSRVTIKIVLEGDIAGHVLENFSRIYFSYLPGQHGRGR
jgi:hypothetical protein